MLLSPCFVRELVGPAILVYNLSFSFRYSELWSATAASVIRILARDLHRNSG